MEKGTGKDYLPYSFWRIKRILSRDYHCRLENIWQGYKANRRPGYCELYRVINENTDEVVIEKATLNGLRIVLTKEGYPLHDKDDWNVCAQNFLDIVQNLSKGD